MTFEFRWRSFGGLVKVRMSVGKPKGPLRFAGGMTLSPEEWRELRMTLQAGDLFKSHMDSLEIVEDVAGSIQKPA